MTRITGIIGIYEEKEDEWKIVSLPIMALSEFELTLSKNTSWEVGIDQSSSCTGISLVSTDGKFVILFDVKRDKKYSKEVFYNDLHYFLKRLFKEQNVSMLIIEKPVPQSKYKNAGYVLLELKGKLEAWIDSIPELKNALFDSIYPQSWKSLVLDPKKGKGRSKDKVYTAEDLCDLYPCLQSYFLSYPFTDYDSFDALGILVGYKRYAFTPDGIRMICGTKSKKLTALVAYDVVDNSEIRKDRGFVVKKFGLTAYNQFKPDFRAFNQRYSLMDNALMAASNNDAIFTLVPEKELESIRWELGDSVLDPNKAVIMYVFRKGTYSTSQVKVLHVIFPDIKEVYAI